MTVGSERVAGYILPAVVRLSSFLFTMMYLVKVDAFTAPFRASCTTTVLRSSVSGFETGGLSRFPTTCMYVPYQRIRGVILMVFLL